MAIDNSQVIPYSSDLFRKFSTHMNVYSVFLESDQLNICSIT